jgi:hypothetical protein
VPGLFRAFDFPSDASSPKRDRTMVPQQALFLMNSPFALRGSGPRAFGTRISEHGSNTDQTDRDGKRRRTLMHPPSSLPMSSPLSSAPEGRVAQLRGPTLPLPTRRAGVGLASLGLSAMLAEDSRAGPHFPGKAKRAGIRTGSTPSWWLAAVDDGFACLTRYQNLLARGQLRQHGVYYYVNG